MVGEHRLHFPNPHSLKITPLTYKQIYAVISRAVPDIRRNRISGRISAIRYVSGIRYPAGIIRLFSG